MSKAEPAKKRLGRNTKVEPEKRQARPRPRLAVTGMAMSDDVWPSMDQMGVEGLTVPTPAAAQAVAEHVAVTPTQTDDARPFSTPDFDLTDPSTAPPAAAPKARQRRARPADEPGQVPLSEMSIAPLPDDGPQAGAPRARRPARTKAPSTTEAPSPQVPLSDVAIAPIAGDEPTEGAGRTRATGTRRRTVIPKEAVQRPLSEIAIAAVDDDRPATKRTVVTPAEESTLNLQRPLSELTIELPKDTPRTIQAPTNATWQGLRKPKWSDFPAGPTLTVSDEAVAAAIAQLEQTITAPAAVGSSRRARNGRKIIVPENIKAATVPPTSETPALAISQVTPPAEPTPAPSAPEAPQATTDVATAPVVGEADPAPADEPTTVPTQGLAASEPALAPAPQPVAAVDVAVAAETPAVPAPAPQAEVQAVEAPAIHVAPAAEPVSAVTTPNRVRRSKRAATPAPDPTPVVAQDAPAIPEAPSPQPAPQPVAIAPPVVEVPSVETPAPAANHVEAPGWPTPGEILGSAHTNSEPGSSKGYTSTRLPSGVLTTQSPTNFRPYQAVYRPTDED